jgi:hypothetical protein
MRCYMGNPAIARLAQLLGIPGHATDATIRLPAKQPATITITRHLTEEEVDALSEWYVTEGIQKCPTGTTTYNLEQRPAPAEEQG